MVGIKVFFYYFCLMIEGSGYGSVPLTIGFVSGRPKNIGTDPTDPDPQRWPYGV
jgi:hypothetical protein